MKIAHKKLWGRVKEIAAMVQKARDAGHDIRRTSIHTPRARTTCPRSFRPGRTTAGARDCWSACAIRRAPAHADARFSAGSRAGTTTTWRPATAGAAWLVTLRNARNTPFQGKRMAELIAARGGDPVEVLFDVLLEESGSVPDRVLSPFRAGHAARHAAALDLDRIRRRRSTPTDRPVEVIPTRATTARFPRARALRPGAARADAARSRQEDDQHERRQDRHQGPRPAA